MDHKIIRFRNNNSKWYFNVEEVAEIPENYGVILLGHFLNDDIQYGLVITSNNPEIYSGMYVMYHPGREKSWSYAVINPNWENSVMEIYTNHRWKKVEISNGGIL